MKVRPSGNRTEEVLKSGGIVDNKNDIVPQDDVEESMRLIEDLKFFLATAPVNWQENQIIRRYYLNSDQGFVSCVFWNSLYYITGTDIVKCCMYRMQKFGREVIQKKKFEEGIFSDLRNLKCGIDATLEQSKSEFLSFLFRNMCLKTQKKQKVFFWFSVPHDKLFADALERDLKRESMGQPSTTKPVMIPAKTFKYDSLSSKPLYEQLLKHLEVTRIRYEDNSDNNNSSSGNGCGSDERSAGATGEDAVPTPMHLTTDIMNDADNFTSHIKTEVQLHQPSQSDETNFLPQRLVVEPSSLDLNASTKSAEILKDNMVVIEDDHDRGDFPLDYFPVEIDYPDAEEESDAMMGIQPGVSFLPPSVLYDGGLGPPEEEFVPATASMARFPTYPVHTPFPMPVSGTRSQFMTNIKYYASNTALKDRSESPNVMSKDFTYMKGVDSENNNEALDTSLPDDTESQQSQQQPQQQQQQVLHPQQQQSQHFQQQQQQQQPTHPHQYLNPYQKYYSGLYQGYHPPSAVGGGAIDVAPGFGADMGTYGYDELFTSQDGYDQPYLLPQESFNWGYVPQQPMQPPPSASAYITKPFTPSYRSTPMSARNPYVQMAPGPWTQGLTSPYGSKVTSATSKSFPPGTYYPQQAASFPRRRPFQGNAPTTKNYVSKHGKITKSLHHRTNSQPKRTNSINKANPVSRTRTVNSDDSYDDDYEAAKRKFSIPTPDSNNPQRPNAAERRSRDEDPTDSKMRKSLNNLEQNFSPPDNE